MKNFSIGFELEYEGANYYTLRPALERLFSGFGSVHSDGSLKSGFELSSKVERSDYFKAYSLDEKWYQLFEKLCSLKVQCATWTGMHVHVGRSDLSVDIIKKLNNFVYSQEKLFLSVGERGSNEWCKFIKNTNAQCDANGGDGIKYRFLNVLPANTIEFRFFRAPSTVKAFLKNMQFIVALIEFVQKDKLTVEEFENRCYKPEEMLREFLRFVKKGDFVELTLFFILDPLTLPYMLEQDSIQINTGISKENNILAEIPY